ncbi:iojap-like ribosome-associated protein [Falseniella ignava CCUG 37419]|uniref:Ribosomal silencing factor RsfS n=1 Tax=Falseniella ignava CCUG 37419 TaxID=883112 RepID=K1LGR2_9LACT|nr:iojap-like ribosome-associated protein [Falseniella ignava CCUG 37419]
MAQEITVLDVRELTPVTDYFIIMHGRNGRQVKAIVDEIVECVHQAGYELLSVEGKQDGQWTLIDLNDVVVHVFLNTERELYGLERIWIDAPELNIEEWID